MCHESPGKDRRIHKEERSCPLCTDPHVPGCFSGVDLRQFMGGQKHNYLPVDYNIGLVFSYVEIQ